MLAHLATGPDGQPERLASEALGYLLASVPSVGQALAAICAVAEPGVEVAAGAVQFSPVGEVRSGERPILLGRETNSTTRVVVDCRFWSPLPELAPLDLLGLLAPDRPGVLVVVAPPSRFTALWAELRLRCRLGGLPVHGDRAAGDSLRWTRVGPTRTLMLVTWGTVLAGAYSHLAAAHDETALAALDDLAALCDLQDGTVFAPLATADLAGVSVRRLVQLYGLVYGLGRACEGLGLGTVVSAPGAAEPGAYGCRLRLGTCLFELRLSVERWATLRDAPFWLLIYDLDGQPARWAEARLERLASEIPPRLLRDAETGGAVVPLFPPVGVDREAVLAGLAEHVSEVARLLGESPTAGFGSGA